MKVRYLAFLSLPFLLVGCKEEPRPKPEPTHYEVVTVQPLYDEIYEMTDDVIGFPHDVSHEPDLPIQGGKNLANALENVDYKETNQNKNLPISKDTFKLLGKNQFVMFQGHGDWREEEHSFLVTNAVMEKESTDPEYIDDMEQGRIVEYIGWPNEGITSKFIDKYCPDITGSIIYLGECFSGHDDVLANSFISKGAVAVLGSSLQIHIHYGDLMQYQISTLLGSINPTTNNYYTLQEALNGAKELYGENDQVHYGASAVGCEVRLFGNGNIRLAEK